MISFASTLDRHVAWSRLAVAAIPLILGCGGHSSTAPNPTTTGTLVVHVVEPPDARPSVTVGGPNNYAVTFGGTDTLVGLAAGTYTLADASATSKDLVVTPFFESAVTGSPAKVVIGDTATIQVTFTLLEGTGHVWITSTNGGHPIAAGYNSSQLTTAAAPGTTVSIAAAYAAFDRAGDLWVADSAGNTISEYAAAVLAASGTPSATVTLTSAA